MNLKQKMMNWLVPDLSTPRGNYHATLFTPDDKPYKLFLMVDGQGLGTLVVNASTVVNLNQTSTDMVFQYIHGAGLEAITRFINKKYTHAKASAGEDFKELLGEIESFLGKEDLTPRSGLNGVTNGIEVRETQIGVLVLDVVAGEVGTSLAQWKNAIDELVSDGFPHILIVGKNALRYEWLEALVAYTEEIGVVCGLATWLAEEEKPILKNLLRVGLDHLTLAPQKISMISAELINWLNEQDIFFDVALNASKPEIEIQTDLDDLLAAGVKHLVLPGATDPKVFQLVHERISTVGGSVQSLVIPNTVGSDVFTRSEVGNIVLSDGKRYME